MPRWREDPASVRPMLASLDEPPITRRGSVYEPKYDGMRVLVDLRPPPRRGGSPHVALYSRRGHDKREQFPEVADVLTRVAGRLEAPLLVDGEIVAVDRHGRPLGFQHLQGRIQLQAPSDIARAAAGQPCILVAFDLLRDGNEDLRGQPLAGRRLRLQQRLTPRGRERDVIRLSELATDDGRKMLERARREGWEGLIVKDGQSVYQSGRRTPAWRKLKLLGRQEFVVGGWTDPRQSRHHFGSLLVGCHDDDGKLRWAGSVGTGFDEATLEQIAGLLASRARKTSPFADTFKTTERAHWVKPDLVVEVKFTEWTRDGLLRHPVFVGLRTDRNASEVRREEGAGRSTSVRGSQGPRVRESGGSKVRGFAGSTVRGPRRKRVPEARAALTEHQALVDRLSDLEAARRDGDLELPDGHRLRLTNLAKVFWPALGITKGELLRYYIQVAPFLLPAVEDRPLVMKRFPNGIARPAFYQQRHPERTPPGVRREPLPEAIDPADEDGTRERLIGGSLTTLLYMAQLAAISQDPWFSRVADPLYQDYAAIDLDPGDGTTFEHVLDVARWVKDELDRFGLPAVPKTSGSRGLHIYLPLTPGTSYETGQLICHVIATIVTERHPRRATTERFVRRRPRGTVYVDYLQNILGKTLATAYSARASDYAGVSTPLRWEDVMDGVDPRDFTIRTAPARFAETGDLWARLRTGPAVDPHRILGRAP